MNQKNRERPENSEETSQVREKNKWRRERNQRNIELTKPSGWYWVFRWVFHRNWPSFTRFSQHKSEIHKNPPYLWLFWWNPTRRRILTTKSSKINYFELIPTKPHRESPYESSRFLIFVLGCSSIFLNFCSNQFLKIFALEVIVEILIFVEVLDVAIYSLFKSISSNRKV